MTRQAGLMKSKEIVSAHMKTQVWSFCSFWARFRTTQCRARKIRSVRSGDCKPPGTCSGQQPPRDKGS